MDRPRGTSRARYASLTSLITAAALAALPLTLRDDEPEKPGQPAPPSEAGSGKPGTVRLKRIGRVASPVHIAQPPGDERRLFVVERLGRIRVFQDGQLLKRHFLDLRGEISKKIEQGLLSIAFAPDYRRSGRFYVSFTDRKGDSRVQEFRVSPRSPVIADEARRRQILLVRQPRPTHNVGLLLFGPDRKLYIGSGDGGGPGDPGDDAQELGTLLGKILRIDPRPRGGRPYTAPTDNPFRDRRQPRDEIFAYGLRNPWRFSFDRRPPHDLVIGDVGQETYEELNYVTRRKAAGANFGWRRFEGRSRFERGSAPGHVRPVRVYRHGRACSVTAGPVVRDPRLRGLYGRVLYGDYCAGKLRSFIPHRPRAKDDRPLGLTVPALSSFGEDNRGRVYALSLEGNVYRLEPGRR